MIYSNERVKRLKNDLVQLTLKTIKTTSLFLKCIPYVMAPNFDVSHSTKTFQQ